MAGGRRGRDKAAWDDDYAELDPVMAADLRELRDAMRHEGRATAPVAASAAPGGRGRTGQGRTGGAQGRRPWPARTMLLGLVTLVAGLVAFLAGAARREGWPMQALLWGTGLGLLLVFLAGGMAYALRRRRN